MTGTETPSPEPRETPSTAAPRVSTATLLEGRAELEIDHRGEIYRLRITRTGKLILTK